MKIALRHFHIDKNRLPKSLIVSGGIILLLAFTLAIALLFYIPIQQKVTGQAFIYPNGINYPLMSSNEGIIHYQVASSDKVNKNQIIATIDWQVDEQTLYLLDSLYLFSLEHSSPSEIKNLEALVQKLQRVRILNLSDKIEALSGSIKLYDQRRNVANPSGLLVNYDQTIVQQGQTLNNLSMRKTVVRDRIMLLQNQLKNDSLLFNIGAIARRDIETKSENLLLAQEELIRINEEVSNIQSTLTSIEQDKLNKQQEALLYINDYQIEILRALTEYKTAYITEYQSRVIKAPKSGDIFIDPFYVNQAYVNKGDEIAKILDYTTELQYIELAPNRIGEITKGQSIYIALEEYQVNEIGYLKAHVDHVSPVRQSDGKVRVYFTLDNGLTSTTGKPLDDQLNYTGAAKIITNKRSIGATIITSIRRSYQDIQQE